MSNDLQFCFLFVSIYLENDIEQRFSPAFVKAMAEASYHFAGREDVLLLLLFNVVKPFVAFSVVIC